MSSLMIMQAAVSSVNWALNVKPNLPKKFIDFLRSLTGRLTKIFFATCSPSEIVSTHLQQYVEREKGESTPNREIQVCPRRENTVPSLEVSCICWLRFLNSMPAEYCYVSTS